MKNLQTIQGILSGAILLCVLIGFFNLLSPELNQLIYRRIFYFLLGISFIIQAEFMLDKNLKYALYGSAALCIVGSFLPLESRWSAIKTIGLFAGVILSVFNRRQRNASNK